MKLGLTQRLLLGGALLLAVVAVTFGLLLATIDRQDDSAARTGISQEQLALANELQRRLIDLETGQRGFVITGQPRFLEPRVKALAAIPRLVDRLRELEEENGHHGHRGELEAIFAGIAAYNREYSGALVRLARRDRFAAQRVVARGEGRRRVDALRARFDDYIANESAAAARDREAASESASHATLIALIGLLGVPLLIGLASFSAARGVAAPTRRLATAAERMSAGDLEVRVPETGTAEVLTLARSFNAMAASLSQSRDELENQNAELEAQQDELARTVGELEGEKERIEEFHQFVARLAAETDVGAVGAVILDEFVRVAGADAAALYVAPGDAGSLTLAASRGLRAERLPAAIRRGEGLAGRAAAEGRAVTAAPTDSSLAIPALGGDAEVSVEAHLPLGGGGRIAGVVSLAWLSGAGLDPVRQDRLRQESEPAAVSLKNALTHGETSRIARLNRAVIEATHDAYLAVDEDGIVVAWSPQAEELFGWTTEEAIGRVLAELILEEEDRPAHHERRRRLIESARDGSRVGRYRIEVRHKDGTPRVIEVSGSAVRSGGGILVTYFDRDVTEATQRERARAASEAVSRVLAEGGRRRPLIPEVMAALGAEMDWPAGAFWRWDERTGRLRCETFWQADSLSGDELVRLTKSAEYDPANPPPVMGVALGAYMTGRPAWGGIEAARDASPRLAAAHAAGLRSGIAVPVRGSDGLVGVLEFGSLERLKPGESLLDALRGITDLIGQVIERRRAELEAERLKDEFFALVSHELRTPLTSITGYVDILRDGEAGELTEEQERFLGVIDRNTGRLMRLVGDLLFVAQVEAGKLSLEEGEVELDEVAREAVEAARPRAEAAGVLLIADVEPVGSYRGDRDRLGQLVDNLIGNAIKFTPADGRIEVRLRRGDGGALLQVSDTGMGIPTEDLERLFERFYRAAEATERHVPGIGLGLSISKAIAEGHGGSIRVESEVGRGTTFTVELPLREARSAALAADAGGGE